MTTDTITISPDAEQKIKELTQDEGSFLRLSVVPGGCSGMSVDAVIDSESRPWDIEVYENMGIKIVTDKMSEPYLTNFQIDYSNDLIKSGFRFKSGIAVSACGCGSSFKFD
ncbi:MAG: iron-sulfur cluster assembly accessory protein [Chitinivibrionales bacterium]|nr:iron-sulfur cluster assembly accessory protein [Chitinivibrionales bacterium]